MLTPEEVQAADAWKGRSLSWMALLKKPTRQGGEKFG